MAKINVGKGIKEYTRKLTQLYDVSREEIISVVNEGANFMADAMRREIDALPVAQKFAKPGEKINTVTSVQKKGLQDGFGISPFQERSGFYNRKLGFAGYNGQKTSDHPHGVPNSLVARSVVGGTSFRAPNNFVGRAMKRAKEAEEKMKEAMDKLLEGF